MFSQSLRNEHSLVCLWNSLRKGVDNEAAVALHQQATFCGMATLPAMLYEVNGYPGAVLSMDDSDRIIGEVYQLIPCSETNQTNDGVIYLSIKA